MHFYLKLLNKSIALMLFTNSYILSIKVIDFDLISSVTTTFISVLTFYILRCNSDDAVLDFMFSSNEKDNTTFLTNKWDYKHFLYCFCE